LESLAHGLGYLGDPLLHLPSQRVSRAKCLEHYKLDWDATMSPKI
jgi:hypothetical protein